MRQQVGQLLRDVLKITVRRRGRRRPLWKLLPALELSRAQAFPDSGLPKWPDLRAYLRNVGAGQADAMAQVLAQWSDAAAAGLEYVTQG